MKSSYFFFGWSLKHNPVTSSLYKMLLGLQNKKVESYIFLATTGRSGTASLQKTLSCLDGAITFHEPYPIMNDFVMRQMNNCSEAPARNFYNFCKSINIRRSAIGHKVYIETNHQFIKSFVKFAAKDFGTKLKIIHLIRDPISVAQSLTSIGHYPGTRMGNIWYPSYKDKCNLIKMGDILDSNKELEHPFYRSLWYWYETEARVEYWKKELGQHYFFDIYTNDLNDKDKLVKLFRNLGLKYNHKKLDNLVGTKVNEKKKSKGRGSTDFDAIKMHEKFQIMYENLGYSLPASLSLIQENNKRQSATP